MDLRVGVRLGQAELGGGGGTVTLAEQGGGQVEMGLAEIGAKADGFPEVRHRFRRLAGFGQETAEEFVRHGLIGIGIEGLLQMHAGFGEAVHANEGDAVAELVDGGVPGTGEVPDGLFQVPAVGEQVGQLRMGGGQGGTEAEGGAEFGFRFLRLAGLGEDGGEAGMAFGQFGILRDGLPERLDGGGFVAKLRFEQAEIEPDVGLVWVHGERLAERFQRLLGLAGGAEGHGEAGPQAGDCGCFSRAAR